jgi:hypothetical protein
MTGCPEARRRARRRFRQLSLVFPTDRVREGRGGSGGPGQSAVHGGRCNGKGARDGGTAKLGAPLALPRKKSVSEYPRGVSVALDAGAGSQPKAVHASNRPTLRFGFSLIVRASGLSLITAAIVHWNTVYLDPAVQQLRAQDAVVPDELLAHLAPLCWDHIALTGDYVWSAATPEPGFRPLRDVRTSFLPQAA